MSGVTIYEPELCDPCCRLYSSRDSEEAHLIRPDGTEVHAWAYPQGLTWHYAEMQPDGNLVAVAKDRMILELDWESRLVWKFETNAHHDFARRDNGNTYVVSGRPDARCDALDASRPIYLDNILEVTPDNETVWEWRAEEHIDELRQMVDLILPMPRAFPDWPHVNTCEILPESPASEKDSNFSAGNLLLCGRHIDTIWVVEPNSGDIIWAWGPGELLGPHMPTMLPNGHLLIYDNGHNVSRTIRGYTRIIELDPIAGEIVWSYQHWGSFFSPSRGSSEKLPNGNVYIAESDSGRLFEVTPEGRVVWEFLNPNRDKLGNRAPFYRTVHYPQDVVDAVLERVGEE